jgi:serine/threonine protein kinase
MGIVYQAWQMKLRRMVALKMVRANGHIDENDLARFRIEAEAAARLQHPNIVQLHEVGEQNGQPFLALEFVPGGSLAAQLGGLPLHAGAAARLVETLALAMHHAHQRGIIHRDLKPSNVLLALRDQPSTISDAPTGLTADRCVLNAVPKITDFGLAKLLIGGSEQTKSGSILGTPSYMAPEQAAGKTRDISTAVDTYALGAILYELLTGRPPFRGETVVATLQQVLTEAPVPSPGWYSMMPVNVCWPLSAPLNV